MESMCIVQVSKCPLPTSKCVFKHTSKFWSYDSFRSKTLGQPIPFLPSRKGVNLKDSRKIVRAGALEDVVREAGDLNEKLIEENIALSPSKKRIEERRPIPPKKLSWLTHNYYATIIHQAEISKRSLIHLKSTSSVILWIARLCLGNLKMNEWRAPLEPASLHILNNGERWTWNSNLSKADCKIIRNDEEEEGEIMMWNQRKKNIEERRCLWWNESN